jgi:hypothetical protein
MKRWLASALLGASMLGSRGAAAKRYTGLGAVVRRLFGAFLPDRKVVCRSEW